MIKQHIPAGFQRLVEAGALMGRTFSFHATYAAVKPPTPDDSVDEVPSSRERKAWLKHASETWNEHKKTDPDQSVLTCMESESSEGIQNADARR